ncbi:MAG: metallophosphoesterase [Candidatus Latescibacterota bacterium]
MSISRRAFLAMGQAALLPFALGSCSIRKSSKGNPALTFGIITDLHYADRDPWNTRWYRDSVAKLKECISVMNENPPAFLIELGDFIDKADKETETGYLRTINGVFAKLRGRRYYVLGNHDTATFSKQEFLDLAGAKENYYYFDNGDYRFIVLDGNFKRDGSDYNAGNFDWRETYIPISQQEWLAAALKDTRDRRAIVLIHQNLDDETNDHGVKNAPEVRRILESAGNVVAVFQGHDHSGGFHTVNGIPYFTLRAAVEGPGLENNAFALMTVKKGRIEVRGFGKQKSYDVKI